MEVSSAVAVRGALWVDSAKSRSGVRFFAANLTGKLRWNAAASS
jgi:hypothetical protein